MTSAYSAFPNRGVRMEPYSIVSISDREGNVLEENAARTGTRRSEPTRRS